MFRGNHPTRIDEKGRLKLPADFKALLPEGGEGKQVFYITSTNGKRAEVWPIQAWEAVEARLAKIPNMDPRKQRFLDATSYYGQTVEMDGQGRLLVPQLLRESASLGAEGAENVVVFGKQEFLEVANRSLFEAEMKTRPLTLDDQAGLADLGL